MTATTPATSTGIPTSTRSATRTVKSLSAARQTHRTASRLSGFTPSMRCGSHGSATIRKRTSMRNPSFVGVGDAISRTRAAAAMTLRRPDGRRVFVAVSLGYLLVYLWAIGHLDTGLGGLSLTVVDDPLVTLFRSEGAFAF